MQQAKKDMMGLQCAVCSQLSPVQVDGLHYNHVCVTGGKRLEREEFVRVNEAFIRVLNHLTWYDIKAAVLAAIKHTAFKSE